MSDEPSKEQLREERDYYREKAEKLEAVYAKLQERVPQAKFHPPTRRDVLKGIAAAGLGAAGMYGLSGNAAAQATGTGEIASAANPALRVNVQRLNFEDLGQEPSSPDNGDWYYNSNA